MVTLYNWSRPRDLAHYEDFEHYHATFYRQVEALSVTPYTRRALDRGTAATFVAAVRNAIEPYSRDADAQDVRPRRRGRRGRSPAGCWTAPSAPAISAAGNTWPSGSARCGTGGQTGQDRSGSTRLGYRDRARQASR